MDVVRAVFGLRTMYVRQTPGQILYVYCFVCLGLVTILFIAPVHGTNGRQLTVLALAVIAYCLLRTVLRAILVSRQLKRFPKSLLEVPTAELSRASINTELNKLDALQPILSDKDAKVFLATFNFYTETKYGTFLAKQAYYTVLELPLQRVLPHILFDSKLAKKQQFKTMYLKAQRISVQGPFDQFFDTYVPQTYAIDSLSFVSPEVMEVLLQAKQYDIEIINNKLLVYAPLLDAAGVQELLARGRMIAKELNDNIDTYRDDRLTGQQRLTNVTFFARSLLRSPKRYLLWSSLLGGATIAIIVGSFLAPADAQNDVLLNQVSIIIYAALATNVWQAYKIMRDNRRALEAYRVLYQTSRGKPVKSALS